MRFLRQPDIGFIRLRRKAYVLSGVIILAGLVSLVLHGGPKLGIDFTGGTLLQVRFAAPVEPQPVRELLAQVGFPNAEIQRFGERSELIIRLPTGTGDETAVSRVVEALREAPSLPTHEFDVLRTEQVGPKIGGELKGKALQAILYSFIGIVLYVTIRYQFKFAVAALIALVHDVLITAGTFSLLDREISLAVVAAILTIIGYSLNDTIVVFDRIREDMRLMRREAFSRIVDVSINQTLSRTIITSGTTLLVILTLYVLGGAVIRDFALALLIGVIVGTYSSIFVASPLLVEWGVEVGGGTKEGPARPARTRVHV